MNLSTTYLGLKLRTPLVPSASPLSENLDNIKRMEDAGASAVVLHSLFEEQLRQESHTLHYHLTHGTESYPESLTYFPEPEEFRFGPDLYLEQHRESEGRGGPSDHRQPERLDVRRLGDVRTEDRAGGRRRAGAEYLLDPDRSRALL